MRHIVGVLLVCSCAGTHEPQRTAQAQDVPIDPRAWFTNATPAVQPNAAAAAVATPALAKKDLPPPPPPVLGEGLYSFALSDEIEVRAEPNSNADQLGTIHGGVRVSVKSLGPAGTKCRWMEIEPMGWICGKGTPSKEQPSAESYPRRWARGYDGRVFKDEDDVRANKGYIPKNGAPTVVRPWPPKPLEIDKKSYYRTIDGELVPVSAVPRYWGDEFSGVDVDGTTVKMPLAWTWFHEGWDKPTPVRDAPSKSGKVVRTVGLRTRFEVLEEKKGWIRVGTDEWVSREDIRIARVAEPPAEVTGSDEVWVDVVQNEQTLVLYRGKTPIHATLVSTGRPKYGTPTGIFHVKKKTAVTKFDSPRPDLVDYHIDDVAWVMHLTDIYAMHGAWWNRGFGIPISLGCVDIPAADIRVVYENVEPKIPAGWVQAFATPKTPGSVVRIRER